MLRRLCLALGFAALAVPASAQLRPAAHTTVRTTDTTANSLIVGAAAGSTTGTGGIKAGPIVASSLTSSGAITVNSVGIIGSDGRIPAISSTYFASLSGANLTGVVVTEANVTDGSLLARVADNETISGGWTFTTGPVVSSATATIQIIETGATADEGRWRFVADNDIFQLQTFNDAASVANSVFAIARTGATVDTMTISAPQVLVASGSAAAPSLSFTADSDIGLYRSSANVLGLATAGTGRWTVDASGHLVPVANDTYNVGSTSAGIKRFFADRSGGSPDSPQYTFADDPNTGLGSDSADTMSMYAGGSTVFQFSGSSIAIPFTNTPFTSQSPVTVNVAGGAPLTTNRNTNDGTVIDIQQDGASEGSISVSGTTVAYNTFMGAHYTQLQKGQRAPPVGTVVVSSGRAIPAKPRTLTRFSEHPVHNTLAVIEKVEAGLVDTERFVYVEPSSRRNQPGVYGIWFADLGRTAANMSWGDPDAEVYQVAGLGLTTVWVTDTCGPIARGNLLATSPLAGLAERQCTIVGNGRPGYDPVVRDYTLGKALVDIDWSTVEPDADGIRKALISLVVMAG